MFSSFFSLLESNLVFSSFISFAGLVLLTVSACFKSPKLSEAIMRFSVIGLFLILSSLPYLNINFSGLIDKNVSIQVVIFILFLFAGLLFILPSIRAYSSRYNASEFELLLFCMFIAVLLILSVDNLYLLFLALELQSLCLVILVSVNTSSRKSVEAGFKYFLLASVSSGFILFGLSMIYYSVGSLNFQDFHLLDFSILNKDLAVSNTVSVLYLSSYNTLTLGFVFVIAGLFFKLGVFSMHHWMPDVYDGSGIFGTLVLGTISKVTALILLVRFTFYLWPTMLLNVESYYFAFISFAIASLLLGMFHNLYQQNLKRIIAYSSITQMGYIIIAFSLGTYHSTILAIFMSALYLINVLGFFMVMCSLHYIHNGRTFTNLREVGAMTNETLVSFMVALLLLNFAGIPPVFSFVLKFDLIASLVTSDSIFGLSLAFIVLTVSTISMFYYLRIIRMIHAEAEFRPVSDVLTTVSPVTAFIFFMIIIINLSLLVYPDFLVRLIAEVVI